MLEMWSSDYQGDGSGKACQNIGEERENDTEMHVKQEHSIGSEARLDDASRSRALQPASSHIPSGIYTEDSEAALELSKQSRHDRTTEALIQDAIDALPVKPDHVSNIRGPMIMLSRDRNNVSALDVEVTTKFKAHFDSAIGQERRIMGRENQAQQDPFSHSNLLEHPLIREVDPSRNAEFLQKDDQSVQPKFSPDSRNTFVIEEIPPSSVPAFLDKVSKSKEYLISEGNDGIEQIYGPDRQILDAKSLEKMQNGNSCATGSASPVTASPRYEKGTSASSKLVDINNEIQRSDTPERVFSSQTSPDYLCNWEIDPNEVSIGHRLAVGGFAEVFVGNLHGTSVAVKVLQNVDEAGKEKFMREVAVLASLRHPNVVLFMGFTVKPHLAILSEYMQKGSLFKVLRSRGETPLPLQYQRNVAISVARGMAYLHSRSPPLLHLDLKSPNVLVDSRWRVKIADFGLSRLRFHTFLSGAGGGGTPEWMAPELLRSEEQIDERADVYSYGVILWECLTGEAPWDGMHPMQVVGAVGFQGQTLSLDFPSGTDEVLADICRRCISVTKASRPSFSAIVEELEEAFGQPRQFPLNVRLSDSGKSIGLSTAGSSSKDNNQSKDHNVVENNYYYDIDSSRASSQAKKMCIKSSVPSLDSAKSLMYENLEKRNNSGYVSNDDVETSQNNYDGNQIASITNISPFACEMVQQFSYAEDETGTEGLPQISAVASLGSSRSGKEIISDDNEFKKDSNLFDNAKNSHFPDLTIKLGFHNISEDDSRHSSLQQTLENLDVESPHWVMNKASAEANGDFVDFRKMSLGNASRDSNVESLENGSDLLAAALNSSQL